MNGPRQMAIATSTMFVSSSMTHQSMVILPLSRSVKGAAIAASPSAKATTQSATLAPSTAPVRPRAIDASEQVGVLDDVRPHGVERGDEPFLDAHRRHQALIRASPSPAQVRLHRVRREVERRRDRLDAELFEVAQGHAVAPAAQAADRLEHGTVGLVAHQLLVEGVGVDVDVVAGRCVMAKQDSRPRRL